MQVGLGLSMEPAGMMTLMGLRQPALRGMSSLTRVRNTYSTAAIQTAVGALKLLVCCADVPREIHFGSAIGRIDPNRHTDVRAIVQRQSEFAIFQAK